MSFLQDNLTPERRLLAMKAFSLFAGLFLLAGGIIGSTVLITGGLEQHVYFVGSIYSIFFGLVVLTVELRDKPSVVSKLYALVDKYLKFLTLQVRHPVVLRARAEPQTDSRLARSTAR